MKKFLLTLAALGTMMAAGAETYTVDSYITACEKGALGTEVTVKGYIVGWVNGASLADGANFALPSESYSNILLAGSVSEKELDYIVPVQLVSKTDVRAALNLKDHPENFQHQVEITGNSDKYFGVNAGIKSPTAYKWVGDAPVPTTPETPDLATGSKEAPLSVEAFLAQGTPEAAVANTYVEGVIVGYVPGMKLAEAVFGVTGEVSKTNFLIAASADVTDVEKCIPVALPYTPVDVRAGLNLADNAGNLGKKVVLCGSHEKYFGANGLKAVTWYNLDGKEFGGVDPVDPIEPSNAIYSGLVKNGDDWTIEGTIPEGLNYVWQWTDQYGMKASAYYQSVKYPCEVSIVSPVIDLKGYKDCEVSMSQAANYFGGKYATQALSKVREEGGEWTALTYDPLPDGASWTFVDSKASLAAFDGKKIQLCFTYISTADDAPTWEIKNLNVTGTNESGVEAVEVENAPVVYYNLQGQRVDNPENGIYVRVQGNKSSKVLVK